MFVKNDFRNFFFRKIRQRGLRETFVVAKGWVRDETLVASEKSCV